MFHLLFFFQFCWVESCRLVARYQSHVRFGVPCEGCGHQSKSHRRKMQRWSVQRNQTARVMWVSVVNSEITRFSVVQHIALVLIAILKVIFAEMDPVRVTCTYSFLKKNRHHFVMAMVFSNLHCLLLVEKLARD